MSQSFVLSTLLHTLLLTLEMSAPLLGIALVVGIVISLLQAITQINDSTLSMVPKILSVFAAIAIFGPWMLHLLMQFTLQMLTPTPGGTP